MLIVWWSGKASPFVEMKSSLVVAASWLATLGNAAIITQRLSDIDENHIEPLDLSDRYIVTLKPGAQLEDHLDHIHPNSLNATIFARTQGLPIPAHAIERHW